MKGQVLSMTTNKYQLYDIIEHCFRYTRPVSVNVYIHATTITVSINVYIHATTMTVSVNVYIHATTMTVSVNVYIYITTMTVSVNVYFLRVINQRQTLLKVIEKYLTANDDFIGIYYVCEVCDVTFWYTL